MVTKEDLAQAMLELKNNLEASYLTLEKSQQKTDEQMKKTDEQIKETSKGLKKLQKLVGNISNNQGDVAEEFFYNSLKAKPSIAGINYDFIEPNAHRSKNKIEDEFDILLVNGSDVAIIEVKYKAHINDIESLINKKYSNFKKLYPEYKNYNHHLGLASFNINDDVKKTASQNNVMLLQRKGDIIETIMPSS